MEITGTQLIPAPRQAVWDALFDPAVLKRCLPGCESVERSGADAFSVIMTASIGPLKARFNGSLQMTEATAPTACKLTFEGQGGVVGFGKGVSSIQLRENAGEGGTELEYTAEAQVGGKLAQVGSRLIDSVARKMADDFFEAFRKQISDGGKAADAATPSARSAVGGAAVVTENEPSPAGAASTVSRVAAAGAVSPLPANVASITSAPAAASTAMLSDHRTLVPGWWLVIAAILGAGATALGMILGH